ncbi:MAG: lysophospholipid acyltransferase family protein [Candidatus Paracaedibacteraceae bacterium]|nr:lysophospholipid acyltransferase family protein [Candidatus Paracaedibacteraceae bacterium]
MKQTIKKFLKSSHAQRILAFLGYAYLSFVFKTTRWTYIGHEHLNTLTHKKTPFIAAFWHGRLAMMPFLWNQKNTNHFHMLLSEHSDGRFISKIISHLKLKSIYGSKTRNGANAAFICIKTLKQGHSIGITPDGPKGPRHDVAEGLLQIARLTNTHILPISYATSNHKFLNTWDRFLAPLPFGKGVYVIGEPLIVDLKNNEIKDEKSRVFQALMNAEHAADAFINI